MGSDSRGGQRRLRMAQRGVRITEDRDSKERTCKADVFLRRLAFRCGLVFSSVVFLLLLAGFPVHAGSAAPDPSGQAAAQMVQGESAASGGLAPVPAAAGQTQDSVQAAQTAAADSGAADQTDSHPWWFWPGCLLVFCFVLGIIAVMAGVGGGVLFVPLVAGFFPFHLDFVRGAGLMVALAGALAAGPGLLRRNLASLRLTLPVALIASACSVAGAVIGLALLAGGGFSGSMAGIGIAVITSFTYVFYMIASDKTAARQIPVEVRLFYSNLVVTIAAGIFVIVSSGKTPLVFPKGTDIVLTLIVGCMLGTAILLLNAGLVTLGAATTSFINMIEPVASLVISSAVYRYSITAAALTGCACILCSLVFTTISGDHAS